MSFPLYRWVDWGTERLCKITQQISSRAGFHKFRQSGSELIFFLSVLPHFYCAQITRHILWCGTKFSEYIKYLKSLLFQAYSCSWNPGTSLNHSHRFCATFFSLLSPRKRTLFAGAHPQVTSSEKCAWETNVLSPGKSENVFYHTFRLC